MSDEIEIGEIEKNKTEKLRISLGDFRGHELINLRVWFISKDGDLRPSNKGLALNVRLIPDLIRLLETAQAKVAKA